jgi:hypothetical protein
MKLSIFEMYSNGGAYSKLKRILKKGKIMKYLIVVFEYDSHQRHTCIFKIPYENGLVF